MKNMIGCDCEWCEYICIMFMHYVCDVLLHYALCMHYVLRIRIKTKIHKANLYFFKFNEYFFFIVICNHYLLLNTIYYLSILNSCLFSRLF